MLASFDPLEDVRRFADDEIRLNTRAAEADQLVLQA